MSKEFLAYVLEQLEPSAGITTKRMFGGFAIRKHGLPIALLFEDQVYFKVGDSNQADYEAAGSEPLTYNAKGKTIVVSNWSLPADVLEDSDLLKEWAEKSYQVALKGKKKDMPASEVANIIAAIEQVVGRVAPDASSREMYGGVVFELEAGKPKTRFGGYFTYAGHVSFEFTRGAELDDPNKFLEGKGKLRRHLKFISASDVAKKQLEMFIVQAVA